VQRMETMYRMRYQCVNRIRYYFSTDAKKPA